MALQLALGDFEELIFEKVFVLESHPQVKITVIPDIVGGSIPLKYAVWGLNIGIGMSFQGLPFFFRRTTLDTLGMFNSLCVRREFLIPHHTSSMGNAETELRYVDLMIKELNFQTVVFILSYQERGIACITYNLAEATDSISTNITNKTQSVNQTIPLPNTTTLLLQTSTDANATKINTGDAENDPHLRIAFQLTGSVITIYEAF